MGLTEKHWFDDELTTISKGNLRRLFFELEELHREVDKIKQDTQTERKGKWIEKEDPYGFFNSIPVCSECGCTTKMRERYNFCPNCGSSMERGEEE